MTAVKQGRGSEVQYKVGREIGTLLCMSCVCPKEWLRISVVAFVQVHILYSTGHLPCSISIVQMRHIMK